MPSLSTTPFSIHRLWKPAGICGADFMVPHNTTLSRLPSSVSLSSRPPSFGRFFSDSTSRRSITANFSADSWAITRLIITSKRHLADSLHSA
ncbi:hypothetical protein D3C85_1754270 [compost metagenome]